MLELLITYLQLTFKNAFPSTEVMGLAEKIQEGGKEFPAFYCTKDEYKPVSGSENYLYFRQNGNATEEESEEEAVSGCDKYITRTYPMVAVAYIPKNILNTDNAFIDSKIANNIANLLKVANYNSLAPTLQADEITAEIGAIDTNRYSVWNNEYNNVDFAARLDHVYLSVEFEIQISATESCLRNFDCNDMQIAVEGDTIVIDFGDQNAWHQTGDVLNPDKKLGSLNNQDWDIVHNDAVIATVKATGIDINGLLTVNGGIALTGSQSISGNLSVTGSINYGSGAIQSLNGLTGKVQTFAVGTSGTDFNIASAGTVHTFNLPDAGPLNRGVVNIGTQTFEGIKIFEVTAAANVNNFRGFGTSQVLTGTGTAGHSLFGQLHSANLTAGANNQVLTGFRQNITYNLGAFTISSVIGFNFQTSVNNTYTNQVANTIAGNNARGEFYAVASAGGIRLGAGSGIHASSFYNSRAYVLTDSGLSNGLALYTSAGRIEFFTANVSGGQIDASQNWYVGAGTVTPTARIHIRGALNSVSARIQTSTAADIFVADESGGVRRIGVFGNTPAIRQVVTGSRGGNAALASLLTAFVNFGFITDNTTP